MNLVECSDNWALITGASSGIGREFARQLAAARMNVVLLARRKELLDNLADELKSLYGTEVIVAVQDLTQPDTFAAMKECLVKNGVKIRLLCNNAAFGRWGKFENTSAQTYEEMIRLNIVAMVSLCHQFLPDLTSYPSSAIINLSSPAAFQPVPYMAVYAATKAFVHSFSQALYGEWKDYGVLVQTLVPGPTKTEFDEKARAYMSALTERGTVTEVVEAALHHLNKDVPVVTTARGTYKQRVFAGLFPAKIVIQQVAKMFYPPDRK